LLCLKGAWQQGKRFDAVYNRVFAEKI